MPKGGGRGSSSKKPPSSTAPQPDDSNVIFAHAGKSKRKENQNDKTIDGPNKTHASVEDAAKKPDTRSLIAGASWTGKLPVNLLSEHCQKQRWGKPEYSMVGSIPFLVIIGSTLTGDSQETRKATHRWSP